MRVGLDLRSSSATPSQFGRSRLAVPIVKRQVQLGRTGSRFAMPEVIHGRVDLLETPKFDLVEDFEIAFHNGVYAAKIEIVTGRRRTTSRKPAVSKRPCRLGPHRLSCQDRVRLVRARRA
jgi:hypothetical protein